MSRGHLGLPRHSLSVTCPILISYIHGLSSLSQTNHVETKPVAALLLRTMSDNGSGTLGG